jgi:FkbM family methyltransferase
MQPFDTDSILTRLGLGVFQPREAFLAAAAAYRKDPLFCVPARAREILSRRGAETPIVMLGRSDFGSNFVHGLNGKARIVNVVDDFRLNRGEQFHGIDIISTDRFLEMAKRDPDVIAFISPRYDYSKRFFEDLCRTHGVPALNFEQAARAFDLNDTLDYRVADWGGTIAAHVEDYLKLERRMGDPYSVETLYAVLTFHLTCNAEWYLNVARPYPTLYFRSGLFSFSEHEKMVDCGASIGESTSALIGVTQGRYDRSWMIEPDRINVATLQGFLRKYAGTAHEGKLSLHAVAVGEQPDEVPFQHLGTHGGSVLPAAKAQVCPRADYVRVQRIDDVVDDQPTILKMDVEGFELPALKGASGVITAGRPKLMVSAYHRATDLLEIPAYIDSIAPEYKIGLRHHTEDRWDTCLYFY